MQPPDPVIEALKERNWREVSAINRALAEGHIDESGWHAAMAAIIAPAYLAAANPYAQAGHSGDAETWEASRGFIAEAVDRSGTFLDVGCANGILMESVERWCAAKNLHMEPSGVEIVPELAELARRRLPRWAHRIHVGNIRTWRPAGERYDFVLVRPEYAPKGRQGELARHILDQVVKADGRLIVLVGNEETESRAVEREFLKHGFAAQGRAEKPHPGNSRLVRRLFWIENRAR